jgi:cell division protein FtsL
MSSQSISFRPTTVIKRLPWSFDKKAALGFLLILVTLSLVGWLYLGQASVITSSTLQMDQLRHEIQILTQKNGELAFEIAQLESINRVEQRAREMGFAPTPPENIRYLVTPNYPVVDTPASEEVLIAHTAPPKDPLWQVWLDNVMAWVEGQSE